MPITVIIIFNCLPNTHTHTPQVGIVCEAAKHLTRSTGQSSSPTQEELTHLTRQLPQPVKQMATLSAYSLPNLPPSSSRTPTKSHPHRSSVSLDPGTPAGAGGGGKVRGDSKKRASADVGRFAGKSTKKRSSSTSNLNQILVGGGGGGGEGYSTTTRASARSISPNRMMLTQFTSSSLVPVRGGQGRGPSVPSEVLIFPVSKNSGRSSRGRHRGRWCASGEWEFAILSQDEVCVCVCVCLCLCVCVCVCDISFSSLTVHATTAQLYLCKPRPPQN